MINPITANQYHSNPVPLGGFGSGLSTDALPLAAAEGALVARNNNATLQTAWEIIKPEVWVVGETHGFPPWAAGGNFALVSFKDGGVTYFGAKPLSDVIRNPLSLPGGGRLGIVGTVGPDGQELGPGFAGKVPTPVGDVLVWFNVRQNGLTAESLAQMIQASADNPGKSFTVSVNFGAAYSVSDGALLATMLATGGTGTGLKLAADAAGADAWLGLGWRGSATFVGGQLKSVNLSGVEILAKDLPAFLAGHHPSRSSPPLIPNDGSSAVASLNDWTQLAFGQSPWQVARSAMATDARGALVIRNGTVNVLNHGNSAVAVAEPIYELSVEAGLLAPGQVIRSNAHAGQLVEQLFELARHDPQARASLVARLINPYNLTFGSPSLATEQAMFQSSGLYQAMVNVERSALGLKPLTGVAPGDYQLVRDVYEGDYRWLGDNPAPVRDGQRRRGL